MQQLLLFLIRGYQRMAPALRILLPYQSGCLYLPSCSEYALQAVAQKGALRGGWLSLKRICRCHPFSAGGVDLPQTPSRKI